MKQRINLKGIGEVSKDTFKGFSDIKITKLSSSLAYYIVFSMGPLLVVTISFCGLFLKREAVEGKVYGVLQGFFGQDTAAQFQQIIQSAAVDDRSLIAIIIGFITLFIGATSIFEEIQDSMNDIWGLKPKPKKGWLKLVQDRFFSFSIIVGLGFLLLVTLAITIVIESISSHLEEIFPNVTIFTFYIINLILTLAVSMLIFAVIFKVLPNDARIKWKDVLVGAGMTTILFLIGSLPFHSISHRQK